MAKQLVGPVERHVEKLAAAVAGLVLIGVIAQYLVSSPNRIELAGKTVFPNTIDEQVKQKAEEVAQRIRNAPVKEVEFEPLYDEFVSAIDPFERGQLSRTLRLVAPLLPEVPIIDPPEAIEGQRELVTVVRLPKPATTLGRTLFDDGTGEARNWVTVSAQFDRLAQSKRQAARYGAQWGAVVFGPVQVQRRARRPGGSWSDDDWVDVETVAHSSDQAPPPPTVSLEEREGEFVVSADVHTKIRSFYNALSEPARQLDLLRPLMPPRVTGSKWEFPIITKYDDILIQDDEYLKPDQIDISEELDDRYGLRQIEEVLDTPEELTVAQQIDRWLAVAAERLANARTEDDAVDAHNLFTEVAEDTDATPVQKRKAENGATKAAQAARNIKRGRVGAKNPGQTQQKDKRERELTRFQQAWAHDAQTDSVQSGATYEYRMRVFLYNRLAGEPAKFGDPNDAKTVLIAGEWSEPSDPIVIEPDNFFFVASCDKRKRTAKIELYRWFEGYWVETRAAFRIGEAIECIRTVSIPAMDDPEEEDRPDAAFDAGATIVDIDLQRRFRGRDTLRTGGVKFSNAVDTVYSVVVAGANGRLMERFVPTDKANPLRRKVAKKVYKHKARRN